MIPKHCKNCKWFDSLGAKHAVKGICAIPKNGEIQIVKADDFCIHSDNLFESSNGDTYRHTEARAALSNSSSSQV